MRALLDTHVFLWWNQDDPQLSAVARSTIEDGRNELYLSAASAWEIAIKTAKGRLVLPSPPDRYVAERLAYYGFQALPIQLSHALAVAALPHIHVDPFDRLLVAQSRYEQLPIITADAAFVRYDVQVLW
jgi:PIN domain nuclease of toxin-antitoxin system